MGGGGGREDVEADEEVPRTGDETFEMYRRFEVGVRVLYTVRVFCVCFSYFHFAVQMLRCTVQCTRIERREMRQWPLVCEASSGRLSARLRTALVRHGTRQSSQHGTVGAAPHRCVPTAARDGAPSFAKNAGKDGSPANGSRLLLTHNETHVLYKTVPNYLLSKQQIFLVPRAQDECSLFRYGDWWRDRSGGPFRVFPPLFDLRRVRFQLVDAGRVRVAGAEMDVFGVRVEAEFLRRRDEPDERRVVRAPSGRRRGRRRRFGRGEARKCAH